MKGGMEEGMKEGREGGMTGGMEGRMEGEMEGWVNREGGWGQWRNGERVEGQMDVWMEGWRDEMMERGVKRWMRDGNQSPCRKV